MNSSFLVIKKNTVINKFDFPAYYHDRGTAIRESNDIPPFFPFNSALYLNYNREEIEDMRCAFPQIFFEDRSHQILWYLNAVNEGNKSVLDNFSRFFGETNKVIRGGINTYKLNGWMVHVLYVYQLISYNIALRLLPNSYNNSTPELQTSFLSMHDKYNLLSNEMKYVLKVLALIHDIGVVDGVQHHDRDGEKYVRQVLSELNITADTLSEFQIDISYDYFLEILMTLVANHTLINKVSAEESDLSIKDKCKEIFNRLTINSSKCIIDDLATTFFIIGMADLIAVDDSLFTVRKYKVAARSAEYLNSIFTNKPIVRMKNKVAVLRLSEMVHEDTYVKLSADSSAILNSFAKTEDWFWGSLYDVYRMEYATAFLKPLKDLEKAIRVLYMIFDFISKSYGEDRIKNSIISFDSALNFNKFSLSLDNGDFEKCFAILSLHKESSSTETISASVIYESNKLKLKIST